MYILCSLHVLPLFPGHTHADFVESSISVDRGQSRLLVYIIYVKLSINSHSETSTPFVEKQNNECNDCDENEEHSYYQDSQDYPVPINIILCIKRSMHYTVTCNYIIVMIF